MTPRIFAPQIPAWRGERLSWPHAYAAIGLLAVLLWLVIGTVVELAWRML